MTAAAMVRPDGRCAMCPKQRKPERSRRYAGHAAEMDPFCSSDCAKRFYGVSFGRDDEYQARTVREESEADAAFDGSAA